MKKCRFMFTTLALFISVVNAQPGPTPSASDIADNIENNRMELINQLIADSLLSDSSNTLGAGVLKGLNFELKMLDASGDTTTENQALGFSYSFKKNITQFNKDNNDSLEFKFDFSAEGTGSFDKDFQTQDFLETKLDFNATWFDNGVLDATERQRQAAQALQQVSLIAAQQGIVAGSPEFDALVADSHIIKELQHNLYYFGFKLNSTLESDQQFEERQFVYGIEGFSHYVIRNNDSFAAKFNLFDYPFKLIRMLTGHPLGWAAAPHSVPRLRFAIEQVDPKDLEERRILLGSLSTFERLQAEIGFSTPIALISGEPVTASIAYRYFRELDAPELIKDAGLEKNHYLSSAIHFPGGVALTYSRGKLPFDLKSESVYSFGYRWSL
jgi:hypothetical protein